ncbi:hypothetical protein FRC05_007127 [Tulasnella sp. 425]|nr:hypothetical protein FRC05_007127 [Tulasnella sp. 425]
MFIFAEFRKPDEWDRAEVSGTFINDAFVFNFATEYLIRNQMRIDYVWLMCLVNDEENVKLCDFGVSKLLQDAPSGFTTTASIKGTLRYSAKELL